MYNYTRNESRRCTTTLGSFFPFFLSYNYTSEDEAEMIYDGEEEENLGEDEEQFDHVNYEEVEEVWEK